MEEEVLLLLESPEGLESDDDELSLLDLAVELDESVEDLESLVDLESDEEELSLLEPFLLSTGGFGRP